MSGGGQREDVSFFRSHYIVILCVGVVFFTSPQWVKALLEWHFEWSYLYDWAAKLGEAAIIGVVVGYFLDKILMKSVDRHGQAVERQVQDQHVRHTTIINASITELKRDVFFGAIGVGIERDIFSLFRQTIVECPVYRDPMRMRITMTLEHHKHGDVEVPVLRCDWYEEYAIRGLQSPITEYEFEISQSTDDLPFMEAKSGITKVTIGDTTYAGTPSAPFVGERTGGYSIFKKDLKIPHGSALKVESYSTAYKTMTDSDSFEMVMPTKNLEVEVVVMGCKLDVRPYIMAEGGWSQGGRHGMNGNTFHWIPKSAMLPHQGVAIQWAARNTNGG
ncbi:hypothetical protein [Acidisphaera sp. S103]|uniref:hypothetical protein n=1 Tax=Acidisphaera sp. S103 TaxID=1747223 RepID=UPI00131B989A|nr:hypothetical protein [Acidisphaera sp. S103]